MSALRPEARFVTRCVRVPPAAATHALHAAAARVHEWPTVAELAAEHRVAGFVLEAVHRAALPVPAATTQALRRTTLASVTRTMQLRMVLRPLLADFRAQGIPLIVLKGPALAATLYPSAALRPYADLDLLVEREQERVAAQVVTRLGFTERWLGAAAQRRTTARWQEHTAAFHRCFVSADGNALLELHADALQLGVRPVCEDARWQRAVPLPTLPGAQQLCAEDQLVQLSVHLHKHGFSRLIWLKDLDLLLRTRAGRLDWDLVIGEARREGVHSSVWYSLLLTQAILGAPVPVAVLARLRPSPLLQAVYRLVWPRTQIADLEGQMHRRAVQFDEADSLRGMVPSLLLMGRRRDRLTALLQTLGER